MMKELDPIDICRDLSASYGQAGFPWVDGCRLLWSSSWFGRQSMYMSSIYRFCLYGDWVWVELFSGCGVHLLLMYWAASSYCLRDLSMCHARIWGFTKLQSSMMRSLDATYLCKLIVYLKNIVMSTTLGGDRYQVQLGVVGSHRLSWAFINLWYWSICSKRIVTYLIMNPSTRTKRLSCDASI